MRLLVAGVLVAALFAVPALPTAQACRISLHDPTSPGVSESCKDPENWIEDQELGFETRTGANSAPETPLLEICSSNSTWCKPLLKASLSVDGTPEDGERLTVNATVFERDPVISNCEHEAHRSSYDAQAPTLLAFRSPALDPRPGPLC